MYKIIISIIEEKWIYNFCVILNLICRLTFEHVGVLSTIKIAFLFIQSRIINKAIKSHCRLNNLAEPMFTKSYFHIKCSKAPDWPQYTSLVPKKKKIYFFSWILLTIKPDKWQWVIASRLPRLTSQSTLPVQTMSLLAWLSFQRNTLKFIVHYIRKDFSLI
jgi:hypothetical protein